jgi:hypothetical protein
MVFRGSTWPRASLEAVRIQALALATGLLMALLVASASATHAKPAPPKPVRNSHTLFVTVQDNDSTLILHQGETLRVVLNGNAGTGYGWDLERLDPSQVECWKWKAGRLPARSFPMGARCTWPAALSRSPLCSAC